MIHYLVLLPLLFFTSLQGATEKQTSTGAYAVRLSTGEVIVDQSSDLRLVPASTLKVVTTAAALELLGPDTQFITRLECDGSLDAAGTLHGNLYICGEGDPCLGCGREDLGPTCDQQLALWCEELKRKGIKKVEGTIIGDASKWEKALASPKWLWEDLGNYYGAGACALSFNENCYRLVFAPGEKEGDPATIIRTEPKVFQLDLKNEVTTGPKGSGDRACIFGSEYNSTQYVRGTIPLGEKEFSIWGAIPNPPQQCALALADALKQRGVEVGEKPMVALNRRVILSKTSSPTVARIVYWTNQESINLYAEHLLKKMGEKASKEGSTRAGLQALQQFWQKQGIDWEGIRLVDGSGLSNQNLITPQQMVAILVAASKLPQFPLLLESLPLKDGERVKTGRHEHVKTYVGYGDDIAFAIFINE